MKKVYGKKEEGDIGIATLILFIAIIIVAAIASSLIIYVGVTLREQGEKVASEAVGQITSSLRILNILGDRDVNGMDPTVIGCRAPVSLDTVPPSGGLIYNVTVNSTSPLSVKISWESAVDTGSGMAKEVIYRLNGSYANMGYLTKNKNYVMSNGVVVATLTSGFGNRSYIDYSVSSGQTYTYAIVGFDRAGNSVLYNAEVQTITLPSGTPDTTPPTGTLNSVSESGYGAMLTWQASDSGSGIAVQKVYRSRVPITLGNLGNATLVATLNGTVRTYIDYPPSTGTWYYAIIGVDRAGNSALYSATDDEVNMSMADTVPPTGVKDLHAEPTYNSIVLTWKPATDTGSGLAYYEIYRSTDYALLTTPEVFQTAPYAITNGTVFEDYQYSPYQHYYYEVIAVDRAGNPSQIVYPQNSIQVLQIKLALGPGSQPVDFNTVIVEITDGQIDASLKLNTSGFGVNGSDATHYSMSVVNDPTGEFTRSYILDDGAVVKMYINAGKVGLTLTPQTTVKMKIIIGNGIPIYKEIVIPSIMLNRYVQIY
ncbi:MAG: flagellin [Euryarchaeota archaeon]|nr:flagellin [Euryarchaeota archaeon]